MSKRVISMSGLIGLMCVAGLAAGCSSSSRDAVEFTDTPESISYSAELQVFEDLGAMTASSDLVVKATVTKVGQGRTAGTAEEGGATTTRDVHLRVDDVIYQQKPGQVPASIILAEGYWDERGTGYMSEGVSWSAVGDSGYYFLSGPDDTYPTQDHYALLWSQGRVLIDDHGISISGDHTEEGPWLGADTSGAGVAALEALLADAAHAASTGKARAVKPEMCARAPQMAACQG